jgi:hypothetical protein
MTLHEEVLSFAREFVNDRKSRTPEKKQQIKTVYKELFGELFNLRCGTCYIAACIKIVKFTASKQPVKKIIVMANLDYQLKPGAILQAFGHREKNVFKAEQLTNELAEWHIKNDPSQIRKFSKLPGNFSIPPVITISPALKIVPVPVHIETVEPIEDVTVPETVTPAPVKPKTTKPKTARKKKA